ncbi:hypothetical protein ABNF65_11575 [Paenibacillus larvae]
MLGFDLSNFSSSIIGQLCIVVFVIMVIRGIVSYIQQSWGSLFGSLGFGIIILIVGYFGRNIETIAKSIGSTIFN